MASAALFSHGGVVEDRFKEFDKNGDGVIAGEEMNAAPILKRLDLDGDGKLTLAEAIQAMGALREKAHAAKEKQPAAANEGLFNKLDKNHDGRLTPDELPNQQWFTQLDLDKNGAITLEEARAGIARIRRGGEIVSSDVPVKPASEEPDFKESPQILKGSEHGIGHLVPDMALKDMSGVSQSLSAQVKGSQGLVIAFFGATCPISQKFGPEFARLESDIREQGLKMVLVCPVASETREDIEKFTTAHGLKSPVIHDQAGSLTKSLEATTTTEVFLLDASRTLLYRGAINDQYGLGYAKEKPKKTYLRDAIAALLKQAPVSITATTAPGCALDHEAKAAAAVAPAAVTYHNQVSRILQANCVECHRHGAVAPFSLETYEDVIENAGMIRKQVSRGAMPPWFAEPLAGLDHSPWMNDRSLSAQDKTELLTWLNSDRPKGDPNDAPRPVKYPEEWTIGKPGLVVQLPKPISIKAEGTMPYQVVTVDTHFPEDRWVQAYEIIPTDRKVVHHVIVQVRPKGEKTKVAGEDGAAGYWAAYVPGNASHIYPAGFAKKLPAEATVIFQIHYTPAGKATEDQLKLGLVFATAPPRYAVHTASVANPKINIPPGDPHHVEVGERALPTDMNITGLMAHMHVRGKAFKFEATLPNGKTETLLDLPRYDFNWQLRYDYAQPKFLPRGTLVKITAVYDNSENNPANPDATKTVKWGQQTYDEMMIGYFEYYTPVTGDVAME